MKRLFQSKLFQKLDEIAAELETKLAKRVIFIFHWDNAGPHSSDGLLTYLKEEFLKRGWYIIPQPSNTPLSNIWDTYVFPGLSKRVSEEQNLIYHGNYMPSNILWQTKERVFCKYPLEKLSSAFMHYHQMVNAMIHCKGGDGFEKGSNALHCGIRKLVRPVYTTNDDGVTYANGMASEW